MSKAAKTPEPVDRTWTDHDSALWYTTQLAYDLLTGRTPQPVMNVGASFPPEPPDREFLACGPFALLGWRSLGDGSYVHRTTLVGGTGPLGLVGLGVTGLASVVGNNARRAEAARNAVPRWTPIDGGRLCVALSGFAMDTVGGVHTWASTGIQAAEMVAPAQMRMRGVSANGPVDWIVHSDWAELVFVLWALRVHPHHPQLRQGTWLPPGWIDWARENDYSVRLTSPRITVT